MVWPLILMAAGTGMQMIGADQRQQALQAALAQYNQYLKVVNNEQNARDAGLTHDFSAISNSYQHDVSDLVNVYDPSRRAGAFAQGKQEGLSGIQQALGTVNAGNHIAPAAPAGSAFANASAGAQGRAATRTAQLADASTNIDGLNAMGQRESALSAMFANRGMDTTQRIRDALSVYQLGNSLRDKALTRAAGQNQLEMQHAQNKGAALMLAGGLLSGAGQAGSSYWGQNSAQGDINAADANAWSNSYQGPH